MKKIRGVKPARRGRSKWVMIISDPFQNRQRQFHYDSEEEASAKKIECTRKIKAIQEGLMTVPANVVDTVLWLAKGSKKSFAPIIYQGEAPLDKLCQDYVARQRERATTPNIEQAISVGHYQDCERYTRYFQEFCDSKSIKFVRDAFREENLDDYKKHATANFKSKHSLNQATYIVKSLITWGWERHRIIDLPRNLESFRKVSLPDSDVKIFTKEEIAALCKAANPRLRLCILLALNAGYTQVDAAELEHEAVDWEAGIIDEFRGKVIKKAKVPRKVKLWPATLKALKLQATDPKLSDLVLLTEEGRPLVWQELREGKERMSAADSVQSAFKRLRIVCDIKDRSFKHFRKTGASLIKNQYLKEGPRTKTNAELFDMYLAHQPHQMVKPYDAGDWTELQEATDWLGKFLGLFEGDILAGSG